MSSVTHTSLPDTLGKLFTHMSSCRSTGHLLILGGVSPIRAAAAEMVCCQWQEATSIDRRSGRGHRITTIETMGEADDSVNEETAV